MISLEVDMVQYDCPYIDTTADHDVAFLTRQWDFSTATRELETRILAQGADAAALDDGLDALTDHSKMNAVEMLRRKGDTALLRTRIGETDAMRVVRDHDGYITGPFEIRDGSERWHIGFDAEGVADATLSELDHDNDVTVESRQTVDLEDYYDLLENMDPAKTLLDGCRDLSAVERNTLVTAVEQGYFDTPRDATLGSLADEFDVSKMAISKNLRRGQRKVLGRVTGALDAMDG